jgi:flagellar motor protein MotB
MQQELAARDQKIAELESQLRQPAPGQPSSSAGDPNSLAGIEVVKDDRAGTVTVRVPGDVLFDSGKATLKDSARSTLNKIAAALKKDYASKKVVVVGHTDSDPIAKTKGIWDDNLDLSAARARTVAKYLSDQGVSQKLLGMQAKADTEPRTNKSQSRRVEIVVSAN